MESWLIHHPIIVYVVGGLFIAVLLYWAFLPETIKDVITKPRTHVIAFLVFFLVIPALLSLFIYLQHEIGLLAAVIIIAAPLALIKMLV